LSKTRRKGENVTPVNKIFRNYLLEEFGENVRGFVVPSTCLGVMQQQTDEFFAETIRHLLAANRI